MLYNKLQGVTYVAVLQANAVIIEKTDSAFFEIGSH